MTTIDTARRSGWLDYPALRIEQLRATLASHDRERSDTSGRERGTWTARINLLSAELHYWEREARRRELFSRDPARYAHATAIVEHLRVKRNQRTALSR